LLGGYLRNLRTVREAEGGAVLLIDAGNTFQGGIEFDPSEGAVVVAVTDGRTLGQETRRARVPEDAPIAREVVAEWLLRRGGHLRLEQVADSDRPRWRQPPGVPQAC
jgi:hypothetical protein